MKFIFQCPIFLPFHTVHGVLTGRIMKWFAIPFSSVTDQGIDLDYRDIEWFVLERNRDHSVVSEIASKYCILDSFVDYDGYSISSKGFLPQFC